MSVTRRRALVLCAAPAFARSRPALAITMDDVWWNRIPESRRAEAEQGLLSSLGKTRAFLFAIGQAVDNEPGRRILDAWSVAGHRIGNHTYRHVALPKSAPAEFEAGILKTDEVLRSHAGFRKWFRFPALKEGNTRDVRDRLRSQRLLERLQADSTFDSARFREPYLNHIWDRAQYYDALSREVVGRSVSHTILVHYTLLNALFLGDVLAMFRARGWGIVEADEAFLDPVFRRQPDTLPAGESLIWALAKESGRLDGRLRYPGEDDKYEKPLLDRLRL